MKVLFGERIPEVFQELPRPGKAVTLSKGTKSILDKFEGLRRDQRAVGSLLRSLGPLRSDTR